MEKERLAGTLTRRNRPLETYLTGLGIDGASISTTLPWGNKLHAEAQHWMMRGGLSADERRISKSDANRLLKIKLAELAGGAR